MEFFHFLVGFEQHLPLLIQQYGLWIYAILFLIIFAETAFIFMFFLPGDSLLLAVGAIAASTSAIHVEFVIFLLSLAAMLGYMTNYAIGRHFGVKIFDIKSRFIQYDHLIKTQNYFKKRGAITILVARFIPFVRSVAPFAAGSSGMNYTVFTIYNIIGAIVWIALLVLAGYLFGHTVIFIGELN